MANGGSPPPGGQYPQQGGGYPPPQGGGYGGGPTDSQGRPLASWGKRVGAALIDGLVLMIPTVILMLALGLGAFKAADCETDPISGLEVCEANAGFFTLIIGYFLIPALLQLAYSAFFNGGERGQTVGKMALKLQTRDASTGGPIGYGKGFLRGGVAALLGLGCGIGTLLDVLWPLWDDKRQTLHDKAANSVVVELPQNP